jgi:hypothetical protein
MDSLNAAFHYLFKSLAAAQQLEDKEGIEWIDGIFSRAYLKKNMPDSAIFHALRGLKASEKLGPSNLCGIMPARLLMRMLIKMILPMRTSITIIY